MPRGACWRRRGALAARGASTRADVAARRRRRSSTARGCACITARPRCWRAGRGGRRRVGAGRARRRRSGCGLERPAVLTRGDRFILRSYSPLATIGGGVVLDPDPPRTGSRTRAGVGALRGAARGAATIDADARAALRQMLGRCRPAGAAVDRLAGERLGLTAGARCGRRVAALEAATARSPRPPPGSRPARRWPRRWRRCWPGSRRSTAASRWPRACRSKKRGRAGGRGPRRRSSTASSPS